jgi:single-strand DNA-binding protein
MIVTTGTARLTRDPESHATKTGKTVTTMRIASDGRSRDAEPTFIDLETWDALAEACAQHLAKGRQIAFTGQLRYETWQTDDGTKRARHKIVAQQVEFLAKPNGNGTQPSNRGEAPSSPEAASS